MNLKRSISQAFILWLRTLGGLFPLWTLLPGARISLTAPMILNKQMLTASHPEFNDMVSNYAGPTDVMLSSELVLTRTIDVPRPARKNLHSFLRLNLRQAMPVLAEQMYWEFEYNDNGTCTQYIVKKEVIARVVQLFENSPQFTRRISTEGQHGAITFIDNRKRTDRSLRNWWWATLATLITTLIFAMLLYSASLRKEESTLKYMRADLLELRTETVRMRNNASEYSGKLIEINQMISDFELQSARLLHLSALTSILPNDVWISDLTFTADQIRFTGLSASDATKISGLLNQSLLIESAEFTSPVAIDRRTGQQRFEITAHLNIPETM